MTSKQRQQGFTLVEIAIVLVIIGLLLGGILKGQELITSARVRNIADQNSGVQAAYYGFVDRFRQVPGDWPQANAAQAIPGVTTGGNGNGRLDLSGTEWTEPLALWEQLSKAGFIQGNFIGGTAPPTASDTNLAPRNAFNGFLALYRSTDYADESGGTKALRLNLTLGRQIPVNVRHIAEPWTCWRSPAMRASSQAMSSSPCRWDGADWPGAAMVDADFISGFVDGFLVVVVVVMKEEAGWTSCGQSFCDGRHGHGSPGAAAGKWRPDALQVWEVVRVEP